MGIHSGPAVIVRMCVGTYQNMYEHRRHSTLGAHGENHYVPITRLSVAGCKTH